MAHRGAARKPALLTDTEASDPPIMIYPNRLTYRVDVTIDHMEELASEKCSVAVKEPSDGIPRSTKTINRMGNRYGLFTGVENMHFEALSVGAIGWFVGLVVAFPSEMVAVYQLMRQGQREEALTIYC